MIIKKYSDFRNNNVNENVQQAKSFLKKRALDAKKSKSKEGEEVILSPEEIRHVETNPEFVKIKTMLNDNLGYVYTFVKFHFENNIPLEELVTLYDKIKEYKSILNLLPMTIDKYADSKVTDTDKRSGYERLIDDLENLRRYKVTKKWVDKLYGDFRRDYATGSKELKEKIENIAIAFDEFGKDPSGVVDAKKNQELQDLFFNKVKRYTTTTEVIIAANSFIKSTANEGMVNFMKAIDRTNLKFGELNGVQMVYDENNIFIIEIKTYQACKELFSNTSWCIKDQQSQWDNYVGGDNVFNKQYGILDFNLPPNDNKSIIGITIEPGGKIRACHVKNDGDFSSQIKAHCKKIDVPFEVMAPMSKDEIEIKKKRVIANKEIVKSNLSVEDIKKYLGDGADPNASQGKPLVNAVSEDNYEKVEYLLEMGAMPNIGSSIRHAKNLKMIKLLVDNGSEITPELFASISGDYDAIEYILKAGIDPNFEKGLPMRMAVRLGRTDIVDLLIKHGAIIDERRHIAIKTACEHNKLDMLEFLLEKLKKVNKIPDDKSIKDLIYWLKTSDRITDEDKKKATDLLEAVMKN